MSLKNLTDKQAVIEAIEEYNSLGRESFLMKYGFGKARDYFLIYKSKCYDSKAIAAVAHGIQHPNVGYLTSNDFSGGRDTVYRKLKSLGFEVTEPKEKKIEPKGRKIWALCANPKRYDIGEAIKRRYPDYWTIGKGKVKQGDLIVIWQTLDKEKRRGVVAFGEVLADPENRSDEHNPYWINPEDSVASDKPRVPVRYMVPKGLPIWLDSSEKGKFLQELSVARAGGGTVFHVTQDQWDHLRQVAGLEETSLEEIEAIDLVRHQFSPRKGQGFLSNAKERSVIEQHAMFLAKQYFKSRWNSVHDVSANSSFDILCKNKSEELRVEVKGTTTDGDSVILTKNEVKEAKDPGYALFVVSKIELDRTDPQHPRANGGICRVINPISLSEQRLKPISYLYKIDWSQGEQVEP